MTYGIEMIIQDYRQPADEGAENWERVQCVQCPCGSMTFHITAVGDVCAGCNRQVDTASVEFDDE